MHQPTLEEFVDFLREASRQLIECGCSSNRVERLAARLGQTFDYRVDVMAIPTGVWICAKDEKEAGSGIVELCRVRSWSVDLDRLVRLSDLVDDIATSKISLCDANNTLKSEAEAPPPYGSLLTLLAGGFSSAILVHFYSGSNAEIALAFPIGVCVQALSKYVFIGENRRYLADFLSAVFVASCAVVAQHAVDDISVSRLIVGGLISLVPGLILVNAVHESRKKNLVSGASKLLEAVVITGRPGKWRCFRFGACVETVGAMVLTCIAAVIGALSFAILFRTPRRYIVHTTVIGSISCLSLKFAPEGFSTGFATFIVAFVVGCLCHLCARWTTKPAQAFLIPSVIFLVPGTYIYRAMAAALDQNQGGQGAEASLAFDLTVDAVTISLGISFALLLANWVMPAKNEL